MATISGEGYLPTPLTPSFPTCPPIAERIETLPITPPDSARPFSESSGKVDHVSVRKALHVISTERDALSGLDCLYNNSEAAQEALSTIINYTAASQDQHGKVVFTGVGKSGWIAQKLVATFNSVGIVAVFLHPTEALHGDLGVIRPNDVVIMITFSGKTQELLTLLPHIPSYVPLAVITSHIQAESCPLLCHPRRRGGSNILLPAPIHISEKETFGLAAPTASTTVALALGDGLALAIADKMHDEPGRRPADVFAINHPGGAIGQANLGNEKVVPRMGDIAVKVDDLPLVNSQNQDDIACVDVLLAAVRSPRGWVRLSPNHVVAPRRIQRMTNPHENVSTFKDQNGSSIIERTDWISVLGDCTVEECKQWIMRMCTEGDARGRSFLRPGTVLGIVDAQSQKSGVVEIEDVVGEHFEGFL